MESILEKQTFAVELKLISNHLANIAGEHILQLGNPERNLLVASSIQHKIYLAARFFASNQFLYVQGNYEQLPFASDSMNIIVGSHILEFSEYPQQILQEIYNTLKPEGYLIISGVNPLSLLGLQKKLAKRQSHPWRRQIIAISRLRSWLLDLGFAIVNVQTGFFKPLNAAKSKLLFLEVLGSLLWPYCGGIYVMVAQKKVFGLTEVREKVYRPKMVGT